MSLGMVVFFFKQKTAYEMRISDWSSDVCSSDLITAAHSIVFIGLLPLATAIFGVLRGGERPKPVFWLFSILGAAAVAGFALYGSDDRKSVVSGKSVSVRGDLGGCRIIKKKINNYLLSIINTA